MRTDGSQLRRPRRRPGTLARERELILAAIAEEVATRGYAPVTVADVHRRAGVSGRTFYDLFADKTDCFLAAYDAAIENLMAHVTAVYERMPEPTPERTRAVLGAVLELFADTPALARMCVVEVAAAGPEAIKRLLKTIDGFIALLAQIEDYPRSRGGRRPPPPDPMARKALVGGIHWVIYDQVVSGETERLPELIPQLTEFVLTPFLGE